ncbi:MAG: hypothetical protein ACNA8W_26740 [Bradymonadaceae bacterium]
MMGDRVVVGGKRGALASCVVTEESPSWVRRPMPQYVAVDDMLEPL